MKVNEVIGARRPVQVIPPKPVAQQSRVNKVASQIATSNAAMPATDTEKTLAFIQNTAMQKRADTNYVQSLKQQLGNAQANMQPHRQLKPK